jgi:CubicO group peptidase (beta-lactamase class C family)
MTVDFTPLVDAARRHVDEGTVPACQLAVARDGEVVLFEAFGAATTNTRFCIFSATKPIVSAAVWFLIGDGLLDISAPVAKYVPEFATNGMGLVTVEQVLLHTAGFPLAAMAPTEGADPSRRRARFARWRLESEPGSRFAYHFESAHWVLVDLIERLSGDDFRQFIERRLTEPLGLPRVLGVPVDQQADIAPLVALDAVGGPTDAARRGEFSGDWRELFVLAEPESVEAGCPGGGAVMTAAELAMFYQGLLRNPGELWRPDVLLDATSNIRCRLPDEIFDVAVNRTIGLVVAGDDGQHVVRYASFGAGASPRAFGHAGGLGQIGWADPACGMSFAYVQSGVGPHLVAAGIRAYELSTHAASL